MFTEKYEVNIPYIYATATIGHKYYLIRIGHILTILIKYLFENVVTIYHLVNSWSLLATGNSLVLGGRPPRGDAEERDVVDDLPAAHVEDSVVRLPQEHRTHLVEPGVAQGLPVPCEGVTGSWSRIYTSGHNWQQLTRECARLSRGT